MASSAAALLTLAAQQIGTMEGRDPSGNWNNLQKYGAWYGMNGVPWCDIFVSWCASFSNNGDLIPKSAYVPGRLAWARGKGLTGHYPPEPGDLGIVMETTYAGNGQTTTSAVHIFIVEKYLGNGQVQTIEGNTNADGSAQGNGVYRLIRNDSPTSSRYIYIRPQYVTALPPIGTGGQSAPPPKPAPAPGPAPVVSYTNGRPNLLMANLKMGATNVDVEVYNKILWDAQGAAYKAQNLAAWMAESSKTYGRMTEKVTGDTYRWHQKEWGAPPSYPAEPGPELLRYLGANPR